MLRSPETRAVLKSLPPVILALNGVGGSSSASLASMLTHGGTMVTYGGMSRKPVSVPTVGWCRLNRGFTPGWPTFAFSS